MIDDANQSQISDADLRSADVLIVLGVEVVCVTRDHARGLTEWTSQSELLYIDGAPSTPCPFVITCRFRSSARTFKEPIQVVRLWQLFIHDEHGIVDGCTEERASFTEAHSELKERVNASRNRLASLVFE
jgi:hypothetical protein